MNHEDYCSYELSRKLKEKGFDYPLSTFFDYDYGDKTPMVGLEDDYNKYNDACTAPTLALAQKWLREVHKFDIIIKPCFGGTWNQLKFYREEVCADGEYETSTNTRYKTYEAALSAAIIIALELI